MRRLVRWGIVALVAFAATGRAQAVPWLVVGSIQGDDGAAIAAQLASALCTSYRCLPSSRVYTVRGLDLEKVRQLAVSGVLAGSVHATQGERALILGLLTRSPSPVRDWRFELAEGALTQDQLDEIRADLDAVVRPDNEPTAAAPEPRVFEVRPLELTPPAARPQQPVAKPPEPAANGAQFVRTEALVAAEAGVDLTGRHLAFSGDAGGGAPPQGYGVNLFARPRLRLELYPAALFRHGPVAAVGLFGEYSFAPGLATNPNTAQTATPLPNRSTSVSQLEIGALWRFRPRRLTWLTVIPAVSYRQLTLKVDQPISGLPDASLAGVEGAARAEIAVWRRISVLLGVGYVQWLKKKDLIAGDVPYFTGGSAHALDLEAGAAVGLAGALSLRVVGEYFRTSYRLDPDPTGRYSSTSASDWFGGARAMLRFEH